MLRNKINKKRAALVAVLTLAVAGTAFAFWTSNGSGSGSGSVGNQSAVVTLDGTVGSGLKPGGSTTLAITGSNSGSDPSTVETITPGAITVPAGCDASWFHVTGEDPTTRSSLAAGSSNVAIKHRHAEHGQRGDEPERLQGRFDLGRPGHSVGLAFRKGGPHRVGRPSEPLSPLTLTSHLTSPQ